MDETAEAESRLRAALAPDLILIRPLGSGGMGSVHLARDQRLKRLVAVKVLSPALAGQPEARARFEREAQAVALLAHPNVVGIHAVGELSDGSPYFVMQYVAGRTVADRIAAEGPVPVPEARRILGEVASGLAAAHAKGIVHRDIKPANILFDDESGRAVVTDFGIAAVRAEEHASDARLTQTGMTVGTPQYMSPEQLLAEPVTDRTDLYGLGMLAHELLTGRGPFPGTTGPELMAAHMRDTPPRLASRRPDVDTELDELVSRCLSKRPADRPTAADVARRLAPGTRQHVEWPPPGLEALAGAAARHAGRFALATTLLLVALSGFITISARLAGSGRVSTAMILSTTAVLGSLALLTAILRMAGDAWRAGEAVRAGYTWFTVLEAAVDVRGDTGALIAGTREYAGLDPADRDRLRGRRLWRGGAWLVAAGAPIPLFGMAVGLASHALLPLSSAPFFAILPSLACVLLAAAAAQDEERLVAGPRAAFHRRLRTHRHAGALVAPWYLALESLPGKRPLGSGVPRGRLRGLVVAAVVAVMLGAASLVLLPLWAAGSSNAILWSIGAPQLEALLARHARAMAVASVIAPAVDPAVDPRRAGTALHRIDGLLLPPRAPAPVAEHPGPDQQPFPTLAANDVRFRGNRNGAGNAPDALRLLASPTFSPTAAERAYLAEVASHPVWREVATASRAAAADWEGARLVLPFPDHVSWFRFRGARTEAFRELIRWNGVRSLHYRATGDLRRAEEVLREAVGLGRALMTGSASATARAGVDAVESTLRQIQALRNVDASFLPVPPPASMTTDPRTFVIDRRLPATVRRSILAGLRDPTLPAWFRFELLDPLSRAPCMSAAGITGDDPEVQAAFRFARDSIARYPSEIAIVDLLETALEDEGRQQSLSALPLQVAPVGTFIAGTMLGDHRMRGCATLLRAFVIPE